MKVLSFVVRLLMQTIVGIVVINIYYLIATIKAAINCYPGVAKVDVNISYGEGE